MQRGQIKQCELHARVRTIIVPCHFYVLMHKKTREINSNRSKETITMWSIRKGNVSRPSDVQWVKVVQCTEPREVVLSGKL